MGDNTATLVSRVVTSWQEAGIARLGLSRGAFETLEKSLGCKLPAEVTLLYSASDGTVDGGSDSLMIRFWPLSEWRPTDADEAGRAASNSGSYFVFADYSLWAHGYAVRLKGPELETNVVIVGDGRAIPVASTFVQFLEYYLEESPQLFGNRLP